MTTSIEQYRYCQKALELKETIEADFLTLAEYLHYIKEQQLYLSQWESFHDFIDDMKISMNVANKLMQIYRTFILGYGFTNQQVINAGGFTLLSDVLPMVTSRASAEKWLGLTAVLTRQDLRKEISEAKTGILMKDCRHDETYSVTVCKNCREKWQVL